MTYGEHLIGAAIPWATPFTTLSSMNITPRWQIYPVQHHQLYNAVKTTTKTHATKLFVVVVVPLLQR